MSRPINEVVSELKYLRMSLLPPYCENRDEDEKEVDDHARHFGQDLEGYKDDARTYLSAVTQLFNSEDDVSVADLLAARSRFAASFPFCIHELSGLSEEEAGPYRDHMIRSYRKDAASGWLARNLEQYIALLDDLQL